MGLFFILGIRWNFEREKREFSKFQQKWCPPNHKEIKILQINQSVSCFEMVIISVSIYYFQLFMAKRILGTQVHKNVLHSTKQVSVSPSRETKNLLLRWRVNRKQLAFLVEKRYPPLSPYSKVRSIMEFHVETWPFK